MKKTIHPADSRGFADYGWLKTRHSFSFSDWYHPDRNRFGALRVLNDDQVAGGAGFGKHPHDNMEIISILLEGSMIHEDSMGHRSVISQDDVQVMSAGTGIVHSEFNASEENMLKFLQIWIFPEARGIKPRYDQKKFRPDGRQNHWQVMVSPDKAETLHIGQAAWLSQAEIGKHKHLEYVLHRAGNGLYFFLLEGEATVGGSKLGKRDAIGITEANQIRIDTDSGCRILAIEVPM